MVESIYNIDLQKLVTQGFKAIIADLDNTLVPWRSSEIEKTLVNWVENVRTAGLKIAIVSNNTSSRVESLSAKLGVICVPKAVKPRRRAFRSIASQFNLEPHEVAVVGDQLFTDILGGNRSGMYTILVTPMSTHEFIGTKVVRFMEKFFLNHIKKTNKY